jgi:hypothetical protein
VERLTVAGVKPRAGDALGRVLGMEVEREPGHVGAEPVREPLGRGLAEAAERSDGIRPDKDRQAAHRFGSNPLYQHILLRVI